ncbi:MAG TPA: hypothetical protein VGQ89_16510 [Candidatus Limnocylindrales bacterium]|nr:hypothetical protein [Candidatus Limnocylindrales bacterium]
MAERYRASAEFRRASRTSPWVLAGVWIDHVAFHPARPGVEPIARRLPETGLLGWIELPPLVAPGREAAGAAALAAARQAWPDRVRARVPFPGS